MSHLKNKLADINNRLNVAHSDSFDSDDKWIDFTNNEHADITMLLALVECQAKALEKMANVNLSRATWHAEVKGIYNEAILECEKIAGDKT